MEENKFFEEEIDLMNLLKVFFKRKWMVFGLVFALTSLSIIISLFIPDTYRSEGFLVLSDDKLIIRSESKTGNTEFKIFIPEYKRYSRLFLQKDLFINFISEQKLLPEKEIERFIYQMKNEKDLDKFISPSYAYSKTDQRKFVQIIKDAKNYIIGTNIKVENTDPETAQILTNSLGFFLRYLIMSDKISKFVNSEYTLSKIQIKSINSTLMDFAFEMEQLELKKKRLIEIQKKYPEVGSINIRQVISVEKEGQRFLSPTMQLIGIESSILDLKNSIAESNKDKDISENILKYFSKAQTYLKNSKMSDTLLKNLTDLLKQVFSEKELINDNVRIVWNTVNNKLDGFSNYFKNILKFAPKPDLPDKKVKPERIMIIVISFFCSIFFSIIFMFLLEWWKNNKQIILDK